MYGNRARWKCVRLLEITKRKLYSKKKKDDGLEGDNNKKTTLPSHLGAFTLSNGKRTKNNIIREINGFHKNSLYYGVLIACI